MMRRALNKQQHKLRVTKNSRWAYLFPLVRIVDEHVIGDLNGGKRTVLGPSVSEHGDLDDADYDDEVRKSKVLVLVEISPQNGLSFLLRDAEFGNVSVVGGDRNWRDW